MPAPGGWRDWALLAVPLVVYVAGFFAYLPKGAVNTDEAAYMGQARSLAERRVDVEGLDPLTCRPQPRRPSPFSAGTSALQSHLVRIGGWQAAAVLSPLALVVAVVTLGFWLRREGFSPLFALLLITFPPTLVAGRTALADVPATALITLATALFFLGSIELPLLWLGAGLLGGLSLMFRDVGPIYFFGYFAAPFVRRERGAWLIALGVALGLVAVGLSSLVVWGEVVRLRGQAYGWSLSTFAFQALPYIAVLLIGIPGSPITTLLYRGRRRAEVVATVVIVFTFFAAYKYGGWESGGWKQLVLGPRYFMPLVPTLVLTVAEVVTRRGLGRFGGIVPTWIAAAWVLAAAAAAFAVHPVFYSWGESQWRIGSAIYENTPERSAVVTNETATLKFVNETVGLRAFSNRVTPELLTQYTPGPLFARSVLPDAVPRLLDACGTVTIALLDRTETEVLRQEAVINEDFVAAVGRFCRLEPIVDLQATATDHLRMWRVGPCSGAPG